MIKFDLKVVCFIHLRPHHLATGQNFFLTSVFFNAIFKYDLMAKVYSHEISARDLNVHSNSSPSVSYS